jgi:inhibitor of cysteine peptidase
MKRTYAAYLLYITVLASTYTITQSKNPVICTHTFDPDTSDKIVPVHNGEQFTITLESNPSTGYIWQFGKDLDMQYLKLINKKSKPINPTLIGTPITEVWTFESIKEGNTDICLIYKRPWEKKSQGEQKYTVTISIKEKK